MLTTATTHLNRQYKTRYKTRKKMLELAIFSAFVSHAAQDMINKTADLRIFFLLVFQEFLTESPSTSYHVLKIKENTFKLLGK